MASAPMLVVERLPGRPGEDVEATLLLRLPSDIALVDPAADLMVRHCFLERPPERRTAFRVRVVVAEAVTNAIECGNGCDPRKAVAIRAELHRDRIRISVSDEGPGFDPSRVPDPRDRVESPCGRGLFIIHHLADQVEFNEKGNTIWMTLPRW